jgi:hypothetical protein
MDDELQELRRHAYHRSRIPALDALETFVADGAPEDASLAELRNRSGFSRWYPVYGGHRVLVLYEGGGFNSNRFTLRKGVWDHEHCKRCSARMPSMTLCWVSRDHVILCDDCYELVNRPDHEAN